MDHPIDLTGDALPEKQPSPDLVLLVYVHGFKGTDVTFESFPDRLQHLISSTLPNVRCETRLFPVYETRGSLLEATERFVDWLTSLTVQLENQYANLGLGGAGKAKIVLCGHSMGGLLIADATLSVRSHAVDPRAPLWPRIVAVIGFDSPYMGLSPGVFKNSISKYAQHVESAKTVFGAIAPMAGLGAGAAAANSSNKTGDAGASGSGYGSWFGASKSTAKAEGTGLNPKAGEEQYSKGKGKSPASSGTSTPTTSTSKSWFSTPSLPTLSNTSLTALASLTALTAAAGTAYYRRADLAMGWGWVSDHILYVKNLWDSEGIKKRLVALGELVGDGKERMEGRSEGGDGEDVDMEKSQKDVGTAERRSERIIYRNYYTEIPPDPPTYLLARTFCIIPATTHPLSSYWFPVTSSFAEDEVAAHIGMFNAKTNEAFYPMGLQVAQAIMEAVEGAREVDKTDESR